MKGKKGTYLEIFYRVWISNKHLLARYEVEFSK